MSEQNPSLYSYWRSSASWRIRLVMNLKGIDYNVKPVNLLAGDHMSDEYKAKNPNTTIPSLEVNGEFLTQSLAIFEYLEESFPTVPLLPKDPIARAKVRALADVIVCDIHPIQNMRVLKKVGDGKEEWAKFWIARGFDALEKMLQSTSGKYCFGDTVTFADCCLVPQYYNAVRFNVDLSEYPTINAIHTRLSELESFQKAHPNAQIDAPPASA